MGSGGVIDLCGVDQCGFFSFVVWIWLGRILLDGVVGWVDCVDFLVGECVCGGEF